MRIGGCARNLFGCKPLMRSSDLCVYDAFGSLVKMALLALNLPMLTRAARRPRERRPSAMSIRARTLICHVSPLWLLNVSHFRPFFHCCDSETLFNGLRHRGSEYAFECREPVSGSQLPRKYCWRRDKTVLSPVTSSSSSRFHPLCRHSCCFLLVRRNKSFSCTW